MNTAMSLYNIMYAKIQAVVSVHLINHSANTHTMEVHAHVTYRFLVTLIIICVVIETCAIEMYMHCKFPILYLSE